jgi:hypothetical protein
LSRFNSLILIEPSPTATAVAVSWKAPNQKRRRPMNFYNTTHLHDQLDKKAEPLRLKLCCLQQKLQIKQYMLQEDT